MSFAHHVYSQDTGITWENVTDFGKLRGFDELLHLPVQLPCSGTERVHVDRQEPDYWLITFLVSLILLLSKLPTQVGEKLCGFPGSLGVLSAGLVWRDR